MSYLLDEDCPTITLKDIDNKKEIIINDLYKKEINHYITHPFTIKENEFLVEIYQTEKLATTHEVNYCAHKRVVYKNH